MGWEWRVFFRAADSTAFVHSSLSGTAYEERTDVYRPVSDSVGLKERGGGGLEIKIRSEHVNGWEKWKKTRCSEDDVGHILTACQHLVPHASAPRVTIAKRRVQKHLDEALVEQTELLVSVGAEPEQVWHTVAVEGSRKSCQLLVGKMLLACQTQSIGGEVEVVCGYPHFIQRLVQESMARAKVGDEQEVGQARVPEEDVSDKRITFATDCYSVVVVRHPDGRWLAVNETNNRGWWLPAGHVDRGQTFAAAAHAETSEEAGLSVDLKGVLAIEHTLTTDHSARMRVIFYAEPTDPTALPKMVADSESLGAAWLTVEELQAKENIPPPIGLRGGELLNWARYIESGGLISSLAILQDEEDGPGEPLRRLAGSK